MTFSDEKLSAYLDGELSPEEMDQITDAVAASDELAARLEELGSADSWVKEQFAEVDNQPFRADTLALLKDPQDAQAPEASGTPETDNIVAFKPMSDTPNPPKPVFWGQAIAASIALIVGVISGMQFGPGETSGANAPVQFVGSIPQGSQLHHMLETLPSLQEVTLNGTSDTATAMMTFPTRNGQYCREYAHRSAGAQTRNIACRTDDGWYITASVASQPSPTAAASGFIPAGAGDDLIDTLIVDMMTADALTSEGEAFLLENGWQR